MKSAFAFILLTNRTIDVRQVCGKPVIYIKVDNLFADSTPVNETGHTLFVD